MLVYDGTTELGSTTTTTGGAWSFTTSSLANGVHSFTAESQNSYGASASSIPIPITLTSLSAAPAVAPTITGTVAGRATTSETAVKPFSGVTVGDTNSGASDTLTITVTGSGGTLSGTGLTGGAGGVYTLTGTAATVTSELDALSFAPKAGSPGTSSTTNFQLSDLSSAYATATVNTTTSVVDTDPAVAVAPTITGTVAGRATTSEAAVKPFSGVTIADANSGASDTLTITVTGAGGTLSGTGLTGGAGGVYTLTGTAATVTSELDALSFAPKAGSPGTSSTTNFQLSDLSSAYATATLNTTTSVVDTDPAVAGRRTITGTVAGRATTSEAAVKPFSGVTIADANSGASDTLTITVTGAGGSLSGTGLTGGTGGVYTLTGTAAAITSELDVLSFVPKAGSPGTSSTTNFQLSDLSSAYATATVNTTTSVVDTDPAGALSLSVAQATALETAGGSAPTGDVVTLSDTAANIATLTAAQIGGLKAIGVTAIAATNASVSLTSAQAVALETAGLSAPSGDTVTLSDTAANIDALTPTQVTGLNAIGVTRIIASGAVMLSVADAMALETAGLAISDPTLSDTAVNIESLTATEILGLDAIGVTTIVVTNASVSFSVAQAIALETEGLKVSAPTGDFVTLSDTAANIQGLTAAQIGGLKAIGVTAIAATNASVSLSVAQTSAVTTAGLSVSAPANDIVTEHNADGSWNFHYFTTNTLLGVSYASYNSAYTSSGFRNLATYYGAGGNVLASESFATNGSYSITVGGVLTQQKTVNADGSYNIVFNGITGQAYTSYQSDYTSKGVLVAQAVNDTNGAGVTYVYGNNLQISTSAGAESLTSGSDIFVYTPHANETFSAAGTTNDVFTFKAGFGSDTISGLGAAGPHADSLNLSGLFTSYASLQSHMVASGSNTIITDAGGDRLTIVGLSPTALTAARVGF